LLEESILLNNTAPFDNFEHRRATLEWLQGINKSLILTEIAPHKRLMRKGEAGCNNALEKHLGALY